jgi:F-type H+-transporting ATPase subunit epsilon
MADTMTFDLVSPERRLVSGEAKSVQLPGSEGDMTAMPDHAPTITTLRPGILSVELTDGVQEFAVTGGFAEITGGATSVLAENAYPKSSEHREAIEKHLEEARAAQTEATGDLRDVAEKAVADLAELLQAMV